MLRPSGPASGPRPAVSWLVLTTGILAISTASILIRLADAPALVIGAYRMLFASVLLAPWALATCIPVWRRMTRREVFYLVLSGCVLAAHFAAWISSLSLTTVASSVILVTTNPIFVGLASQFILKEPVTRRQILAIGLALLGTVIVSIGDLRFSGQALLGDLLALLGAVAVSCYLLLGRVLRRSLPTIAYVWPCYSIAAIVLLAACIILGQPLLGYMPATIGYMAMLAVVPQIIGHSAFNWALAHFSPVLVTLAILGEPIGASVLAYILLKEMPTTITLVGAAFTLTGIIFASLEEHRLSGEIGSAS